jgi:hypothetical protein
MSIIDKSFMIRKANATDHDIFYQSYTSSYGISISTEVFFDIFKKSINNTNFLFIVLEVGPMNSFAGCCIVKFDYDIFDLNLTTEIKYLYVNQKFRKFNAAEYICNYVEKMSVEKGANKIKVDCAINSTLNQHFYARRKFVLQKKGYLKSCNSVTSSTKWRH